MCRRRLLEKARDDSLRGDPKVYRLTAVALGAMGHATLDSFQMWCAIQIGRLQPWRGPSNNDPIHPCSAAVNLVPPLCGPERTGRLFADVGSAAVTSAAGGCMGSSGSSRVMADRLGRRPEQAKTLLRQEAGAARSLRNIIPPSDSPVVASWEVQQ